MSKTSRTETVQSGGPCRRFAARMRRDENGQTALEFGLVALPFLMLVFGIIGSGLFFFTAFSLEHAVEQASRQIRTGAYKAANSQAGMSTLDFKNLVCSYAPAYVDCNSKVRVFISVIPEENINNAASTGFSGGTSRPACLNNSGSLVSENSNSNTKVTAGASQIVQVLVCYQFDLAASMPFLQLGKVNGTNTSVVQASAVFRTEPFE